MAVKKNAAARKKAKKAALSRNPRVARPTAAKPSASGERRPASKAGPRQPFNWIEMSRDNLTRDAICCGTNDPACAGGVQRKISWLNERFRESYTFRRPATGQKAFIEYGPSEKAWMPVEASGWITLHCLLTTGTGRGKGYGRGLLESVIKEGTAQKKYGVLAVAGKKHLPLIPDARFFARFGFQVLDEAPPHFVLMGLRLRPGGPDPRFREKARNPGWMRGRGLTFVYTDRCPLAEPCALELEKTAEELNIPYRAVRCTGLGEARDFPCASSIGALFLDGRFITHELLTGARLKNLLRKEGAI